MIAVVFNWSVPAREIWDEFHPEGPSLPVKLVMTQVPRAGDHLDFGDDFAGTVRHVTWDLSTGQVYVYVVGEGQS